jgi:broad specificity phosphatase PhoE
VADKKLVAIIVRHGDTTLNDDGCFRSRLDPPLNENGLEQVNKLAKAIAKADYPVERIVTSPLLRAVQTADAISEEINIPVEQDRGLSSWNLGFMGGKNKEVYNDILDYYIDNPKKVIPDGECLDDLEVRIYEFFKKELKGGLAVYVTHNSNIVTLDKLIDGSKAGRPESTEASVETGGAIGVYVDDEGNYSTEVLFGEEKQATFGS